MLQFALSFFLVTSALHPSRSLGTKPFLKEFFLVMKGFEDSSLGHVFSERRDLLFIYFFYSGDERYISVLIFLVLFSRMGR